MLIDVGGVVILFVCRDRVDLSADRLWACTNKSDGRVRIFDRLCILLRVRGWIVVFVVVVVVVVVVFLAAIFPSMAVFIASPSGLKYSSVVVAAGAVIGLVL